MHEMHTEVLFECHSEHAILPDSLTFAAKMCSNYFDCRNLQADECMLLAVSCVLHIIVKTWYCDMQIDHSPEQRQGSDRAARSCATSPKFLKMST